MRLTEKYKEDYVANPKLAHHAYEIYQKLGQIEDLLNEFNILDLNELRVVLENERKGTDAFAEWWEKRFAELMKPYKDIEEEIGINLITLFKALKDGVYYKDYLDNKIKRTNNLSLINFNKKGYALKNKTHYFELSNYKISWALTKSELL